MENTSNVRLIKIMKNDLVSRNEFTKTNDNFMKEIKQIKQCINDIKVDIAKLPEHLIEKLDEKYVSKEAFKPVQKIVYGLVGAILLMVIGAILALIIK